MTGSAEKRLAAARSQERDYEDDPVQDRRDDSENGRNPNQPEL